MASFAANPKNETAESPDNEIEHISRDFRKRKIISGRYIYLPGLVTTCW